MLGIVFRVFEVGTSEVTNVSFGSLATYEDVNAASVSQTARRHAAHSQGDYSYVWKIIALATLTQCPTAV
jgi:hypothetical protein